MSKIGYYRHPAIFGDSVVFACEGDLWQVTIGGDTRARRLTTTAAGCLHPRFSRDGEQIAFSGREDGPRELYVIPSVGGAPTRLTYMGNKNVYVSGWTKDGKILFSADAESPFAQVTEGFEYDPNMDRPVSLSLGMMIAIALGDDGASVIGRNNYDPAKWKRYRGGMKGQLWLKGVDDDIYKTILEKLNGNIVWPMWVSERIFFLSDHEGVGNIYSSNRKGEDVQKHTNHTDYYARFPSTDGKRIVYSAGADIWLLDPETGENFKLEITVPRTTNQSERKFVPATKWLTTLTPHPSGSKIAMIARGQPITTPLWDGAPVQHGKGNRVRYRLIDWMKDGKRFVVVNDEVGFERLELHYDDQSKPPVLLTEEDYGRFIEVSANGELVAVTNHKNQLLLIDTHSRAVKQLDSSDFGAIGDLSWSPDPRWLAYTWPSANGGKSRIRVADIKTGIVHDVTKEVRFDRCPTWDPLGDYLFFVSARTFVPVSDALRFDYGFPLAEQLFAVALREDVRSPFVQDSTPLVKQTREERLESMRDFDGEFGIDFDAIATRIAAFPGSADNFGEVVAVRGRVLYTTYPVDGSPEEPEDGYYDPTQYADLCMYDFEQQRHVYISSEVSYLSVAKDGDFAFFVWGEEGNVVRVFDPLFELSEHEEYLDAPPNEFSRRGGLIDLNLTKVEVNPQDEWWQMLHETWRLQQQHFWDDEMSGVDWKLVLERYLALLPRVRTREEFSDLIWEMQGELGTSHCYEWEGDYPTTNEYHQGYLGADLVWDKANQGYRIEKIIRGDEWKPTQDSPLATLGSKIAPKEIILKVGGRPVSPEMTVERLLVNQNEKPVSLTIKAIDGVVRQETVVALKSETLLRYRAWVNENRDYVHRQSGGKVGYLHIPDMDHWGIREFRRGFLEERGYDGLVVDLRFNRGGNVSQIIMEELRRKVIGYDVSRWSGPSTYPSEAHAGPKVGITNEFAGSDGDIGSHAFKMYGIGPLVGKRTWGGVIGIWPKHQLVDGTTTTQPEYAFWFSGGAGWSLENLGTTPDHDVDIAPHHYAGNEDPQLDKAIELILAELEANPVKLPDFQSRPSKALPFTERSTTSGVSRRKRKPNAGKTKQRKGVY